MRNGCTKHLSKRMKPTRYVRFFHSLTIHQLSVYRNVMFIAAVQKTIDCHFKIAKTLHWRNMWLKWLSETVSFHIRFKCSFSTAQYCGRFQNDQEAWLELVELYCHEFDYSKAAFCMEEALIHHPHSHLYHQRYAEIRYALGGYDNMETARGHFAKAVKLCRSNTDALFGMCTVSSIVLWCVSNSTNLLVGLIVRVILGKLSEVYCSETER